jgi:hypothetical protein
MWRQRNSVNHTVSGIPASAGADAILQHLLAAPDSEADLLWLAAHESLLQSND